MTFGTASKLDSPQLSQKGSEVPLAKNNPKRKEGGSFLCLLCSTNNCKIYSI